MADVKARKPQVDAKTFVTAFQSSATLDEVAEKLGIAKQSIQTRASTYRKKHGIPLKKFPKGGAAKLDVAGLSELAESLV